MEWFALVYLAYVWWRIRDKRSGSPIRWTSEFTRLDRARKRSKRE